MKLFHKLNGKWTEISSSNGGVVELVLMVNQLMR